MLKNIHLVLKWIIYVWCALFLGSIVYMASRGGDGVPGLVFFGFMYFLIPLLLVIAIRSYIGTILKERSGVSVPRPSKAVNFAYFVIILLAVGFSIYIMNK